MDPTSSALEPFLYVLLFNLAKVATIGWVLLVFFPLSNWTNKIIDEGIFPLYLSVLYTISVVAMVAQMGPALLTINFANYMEVYRLFSNVEFWTVFWLHILAFDQVVGMMIYNDNQQGKYISYVPLQSFILLLVLFVGPIGMLVYLILRSIKRQQRRRQGVNPVTAHGAPAQPRATATA